MNDQEKTLLIIYNNMVIIKFWIVMPPNYKSELLIYSN